MVLKVKILWHRGRARVVSKDDGVLASSKEDTKTDTLYIRINGGKVNVFSGKNGLNSKGDIYIDGWESLLKV